MKGYNLRQAILCIILKMDVLMSDSLCNNHRQDPLSESSFLPYDQKSIKRCFIQRRLWLKVPDGLLLTKVDRPCWHLKLLERSLPKTKRTRDGIISGVS